MLEILDLLANEKAQEKDIKKETSERFKICVESAPSVDSLFQLKNLLSSKPGINVPILCVDGKELALENYKTSLNINDSAMFKTLFKCSIILDSVETRFDEIAEALVK
jgi:hypothetical protein